MLADLPEDSYRIATSDEESKILEMDLINLRETFVKAPVIMVESELYAVVEGVAYPIKKMAAMHG